LLKTKATRICGFEVPNISPDISNLRSIQATALREDIPSARQLEEIASAVLFDYVRNLHRLLREGCARRTVQVTHKIKQYCGSDFLKLATSTLSPGHGLEVCPLNILTWTMRKQLQYTSKQRHNIQTQMATNISPAMP